MNHVKLGLTALDRTDDFWQIAERLVEVKNADFAHGFGAQRDLVLCLHRGIIDKDRVALLNLDEGYMFME